MTTNKLQVGFLIFLLIAPLFGNTFWLELLIASLYLAYQTMSWNIIGGLAGQISLGHSIFIAAGSYVSTFLFIKYGISPWFGIFAGGIFASIIALAIGTLSFRYNLKGIFFAMVTLAFAQITKVIIENTQALGGAYGLLIPIVRNPMLFQFSHKISYYYVILIMTISLTIIIRLISSHKIGSYLVCIRENEQAAEAIGVNPLKYKLIAFMLSAFFGALGGTFMAQYTLFIDPNLANWSFSITILIASIAGGMKSPMGALVGGFVLQPISEVVRLLWADKLPGLNLVIYGVILIIIVLYMPEGLIKGFDELFHRFKSHRQIDETSRDEKVIKV